MIGRLMDQATGYARLHDYNRVIRDIATSADWHSGNLANRLERVVQVAARYMGVGRVAVWRFHDSQTLVCDCQFDTRDGLSRPELSITRAAYPQYFDALSGNRVLAVSDADTAPATAELVETYLRPHHIVSLLDVPIRLDGAVVGVVCHEHTGDPRVWREEDIAFAGSMGDFCAMALSYDLYQQALSSRERLARIIEATPDLVAILSPEGFLRQINPAGRRLLGLAPEAEIERFRVRDFLGADTVDCLETEILPALAGAGRWTGETVLAEDTPRALPVSVIALAHRDAAGQLEYISVTLHDLSAQKTIQAQIKALNEQLEARVKARTQALEFANRNLESFAYSVSHDLKAPLRGIAGYSRLLATDYGDALPPEARDFVDAIESASQRMDRMIEDILAYSRVQLREVTLLPTAIDELVGHVLAEFAADPSTQAVLSVDMAPDTRPCDREGLSQVLRNFLTNAVKYTRAGAAPQIHVEGRLIDGRYRIAVSDQGTGFDMRFHDRIFEMFQRLPEASERPGSGVGLALAARAAERMGARVWADSEPGQGATFFVELNGGISE